jgi:hypothetical protein
MMVGQCTLMMTALGISGKELQQFPPMSCCIHHRSLENGSMAGGKGIKLSTYNDFVLAENERRPIVNVIP